MVIDQFYERTAFGAIFQTSKVEPRERRVVCATALAEREAHGWGHVIVDEISLEEGTG